MANPGKNKLIRWTRFIMNGYDLSGDSRNFANLDHSLTQAAFNGWNQEMYYKADGNRAIGVADYQAFFNDATTGAFTQIKDLGTAHELSVLFGGGGEPEAGDPAYLLCADIFGAAAGHDGPITTVQTSFLPGVGIEQGNPWGKIVMYTTINSTGNSSGVLLSTGSVGFHANLHILATTSGNFSFTLEDSPTDSVYSTLGSFTIDGSTINSEHISGTGSVDQYIRLAYTRTAGSVLALCTVAVNYPMNIAV